MKIFPPLSEMLWPPGYSAGRLLWARRYPITVLSALFVTIIGWTFYQPTEPATSGIVTGSIARPGQPSACSTLLRGSPFSGPTPIAVRPCPPNETVRLGASLRTPQPLNRSSFEMRDGQLTAADRAIVPPSLIRPTVWDKSGRTTPRPAETSPRGEGPALKLQPSYR